MSNEYVWSLNDAPGFGAVRVLRCAVECDSQILTNETPFKLVYEFEVLEDKAVFEISNESEVI